jgi:hypothetical protein
MKNPIPQPLVSDTTTAEFRINPLVVRIAFSRQKLSELKSKILCAITVKPDNPLLLCGKSYSFIVFAARITPTLDLEQVGDGFPCVDESRAKNVAEVIEAKNQKVPHLVLMSTPGFFHIGTVTNVNMCQERLVLFKFHVPKTINSRRCGFALRLYKCFVDKPRELIWEEMLPTINSKVAEKMLRQKSSEMDIKEATDKQNFAAAEAKTKVEPNLTQSQLKVLSKAYPETVAFLANPNMANTEAAYAAYQRETFALTGQLVGTLNKTEFEKTAKALKNASRRKNEALNSVEFQLVAGWRLRGYDRMTPKQRFDDLKSLELEPASPEAVRKICERLKLPSVCKRGAPRKSGSEK